MRLFKKKNPEDIYLLLAHHITYPSLLYGKELETEDNKKRADAGEEMLYFFLYVLDVYAFKILGEKKRDEVFDKVYERAIYDYCTATLKDETPKELVTQLLFEMIDKLNERQSNYSKCNSILGEGFSSRGTAVFALSFFIHKALGKTKRSDVKSIFEGKRDLKKEDLKDFPDSDFVLKLVMFVGNVIKESNFPKLLKRLK